MRNAAQLQADAWAFLVKGLGPGDALRYRILFETGQGDYAREREEILDHMSLADWRADIERWRAAAGRGGMHPVPAPDGRGPVGE